MFTGVDEAEGRRRCGGAEGEEVEEGGNRG